MLLLLVTMPFRFFAVGSFYLCRCCVLFALLLLVTTCFFFPQQRKLMGSSAQISSGVCRCGSQKQVPEAGSGRFRKVPVCAGVGSGDRFRFRRQVPEGSGRFRRQVPEGSGVCWCRFRRQVPEGSGACWWCRFRRQVPEGSGGFRCVLV